MIRRNNNVSDCSVTDDVSLPEIIYNVRDAVVNITTETSNSSGFFIKDHYIICPAQAVISSKKILVTVSNVNGKSYVYLATIIGLDLAGNIAILIINQTLNNHPFLLWGKSRNTSPGETVIIIGDITDAESAVIITNICDNRYVSYDNSINGELLLLANNINKLTGLPVLSTEGKFIGMMIDNNLALSEFFVRRIIKGLIKTYVNKYVSHNYNGFIIKDPSGDYYRYVKGCIGIQIKLVTAQDFLSIDDLHCAKEIIGYKITKIYNDAFQVAKQDNQLLRNDKVVASGAPDITKRYPNIEINDIITHINKCPLGDRKGQISPALIMWRVLPNTSVTVRYCKISENYEMSYEMNVMTISSDNPSII